jgi:predicted kinase
MARSASSVERHIIKGGFEVTNKIILVGGYCATGKSTFSRKLAARLNIPCFNKDTLKETLGDAIGAENTAVIQNLSGTVFTLMLHIAKQFLQSGKICIFESNFRPSEIEKLKMLFENYKCECLLFLFKGNLDVLYNRYLERDRVGLRHWVHHDAGETAEYFKAGNIPFGAISLGKTVIVDTTSFDSVDYDELFTVAKNFTQNSIDDLDSK